MYELLQLSLSKRIIGYTVTNYHRLCEDHHQVMCAVHYRVLYSSLSLRRFKS
jgi:hypothetical protein